MEILRMQFKRQPLLIICIILFLGILLLSLLHIIPLHFLPIQPKPETQSQNVYEYYIIIDESDGHSLMYVPLVVNIGDEVVTEENKRYKVVKIEQNFAFARFIEEVNLEKYKK